MMMHFQGGGVSHKSVQKATNYFLHNQFPDDIVDLDIEDNIILEGVEELLDELGSSENMDDEIDEEISDNDKEDKEGNSETNNEDK
jgi:hypothetical protein